MSGDDDICRSSKTVMAATIRVKRRLKILDRRDVRQYPVRQAVEVFDRSKNRYWSTASSYTGFHVAGDDQRCCCRQRVLSSHDMTMESLLAQSMTDDVTAQYACPGCCLCACRGRDRDDERDRRQLVSTGNAVNGRLPPAHRSSPTARVCGHIDIVVTARTPGKSWAGRIF